MNNALQWFRFYRNHDCVLSFRQAYFGIKLDRRMRVVGSFRTIDLSLVNDKRVGCQCSGHAGWGHVYKSIYHWENKNSIASTDCNYLVRIDSRVIGFDLERHKFPRGIMDQLFALTWWSIQKQNSYIHLLHFIRCDAACLVFTESSETFLTNVIKTLSSNNKFIILLYSQSRGPYHDFCSPWYCKSPDKYWHPIICWSFDWQV